MERARGRRIGALVAATTMVVAALFVTGAVGPADEAAAWCNGVGNYASTTTSWGKETWSGSTCDNDTNYWGRVYDLIDDYSCVWMTGNPGGVWQVISGQSCVTGGYITYNFWDSNSYMNWQMCRGQGCTSTFVNRGF